jgi:pimeloyl-ACP methyl ester carboxylesterase
MSTPVTQDQVQSTLTMSDGWNLEYSCFGLGQPKAVLVFLHGLGVDPQAYTSLARVLSRSGLLMVLPSLRCDPDPRSGIIDLADVERQTDDLIALLDQLERDHPGLPIGMGAHSVGCSLVLRSMARLEKRVTGFCLIAPVWAGHPDYTRKNIFADKMSHFTRHWYWPRFTAIPDVLVNWSLLNMYIGRWSLRLFGGIPMVSDTRDSVTRRYSFRHFASFFCADLERQLQAATVPMFFALVQDDEYSLSSSIGSSLHWDRSAGSRRTIVVCVKANHVTIMASCIVPLLQWLKRFLLAAGE